MKKAFVALLAVALVSWFAYADDAAKPVVSVTGNMKTGFVADLQTKDTDTAAKTIKAWDNDDGTPLRATVDFGVTLGDTTAHLITRSTDYATNPVINAYIGQNFFDKALTVRAGEIDPGVVSTENKGWNSLGIQGVQISGTPMAGLVVGLAIPTPVVAVKTSDAMKNFRVGAEYILPSVARFDFVYFGKTAIGSDTGSVLGKDGAIEAGVSYKAIAGLTAQAEVQYVNGQDANGDSDTSMELFLNGAYKIDAMTPSLAVVVYSFKNENAAYNTKKSSIKLDPCFDYAIGKNNVGVEACYYTEKGTESGVVEFIPYVKVGSDLGTCKIYIDATDVAHSGYPLNFGANWMYSF
jgi:hypothetical protein